MSLNGVMAVLQCGVISLKMLGFKAKNLCPVSGEFYRKTRIGGKSVPFFSCPNAEKLSASGGFAP